jgi:hypothetical protein
MIAFRPRMRALLVGAGAVALVTIGAGGTLAASTPTVYACFNVYGQVSMSSSAQCRLPGGGQLVQINAAGVPGPTGPTGPTGATVWVSTKGAERSPRRVQRRSRGQPSIAPPSFPDGMWARIR